MIKRCLAQFLPVAVTLILATGAPAAVSRLEITHREPYLNGQRFGKAGAYERLLGKAYFSVDPRHSANRPVVDLNLAPRTPNGQVEFAADFELLVPADRSHANGVLLYEVNNRGRMLALGMFNSGAEHFLMRQGYTILSSGWIAELLPANGVLRLHAPVARGKNGPLREKVRAEVVPDSPAQRLNIAHWGGHGSYRPTERGLSTATLTYREKERDPRIPVPREQWKLEVTDLPAPAGETSLPRIDLILEGGFRPGHIYELIYEAQDPIVQGLGFAGIRDLVSHLKHATANNPLSNTQGRSVIKNALGFGVSQSGRALRMFLYDGFNADEQGRRVFDGLMPHVAGAGMGFFNHRFASPTRHNAQHDNHLYPADVFPFTYGDEKNPFTGRTDGLLRRARRAGVVPKIFHTHTSAEYWHRAASLVHTDPRGRRDAILPPEVRIYAIGGAQHGPGSGIPGARGQGQLLGNPTDYRPLLRGLLTALHEWVRDGRTPPPSRYPKLSEGTLKPWPASKSHWNPLAGVRYPEVIQQPQFLDYGPEFFTRRRITHPLPKIRGEYVVLVPAYDGDNNERGMLQLPSVSVPIGSYLGWNLRHPSIGAESELLSLSGAFIPFARNSAERRANQDPRPALTERYPNPAAYQELQEAAVRQLIRDRYVLPEEEIRLLNLSKQLWNHATNKD